MPEAFVPTATPAKPRGLYHGWHIAWVAFLSTGFTIGMSQYSFGVFVDPLEAQFGWSRTQINASLSIGLLGALLAPVVGWLIDRAGARSVVVVSLLLLACGFVVAALMHALWQFYLSAILINVAFPGATVLPAGRLIALWFPDIRGRMTGVVMAGNNFGGLTMVPLATAIVGFAGWRWAYGSFAVLVSLLAVAAWFIIRDEPAAVARQRAVRRPPTSGATPGPVGMAAGLTVPEALAMPSFYLLTAGVTIGTFTYYAVLPHNLPHRNAVGFSEGAAASGLTVAALFGLASKVVFGRISEWMTARLATVLSLAIQSAAVTLLILAGGSALAWPAVILFGSGYGGLGALIPLVVAESFGLRRFGSLLGLVNLASILPVVAGPLMAGAIFDHTGSYNLSFTITVGFFVVGALCMLIARPPRARSVDAG